MHANAAHSPCAPVDSLCHPMRSTGASPATGDRFLTLGHWPESSPTRRHRCLLLLSHWCSLHALHTRPSRFALRYSPLLLLCGRALLVAAGGVQSLAGRPLLASRLCWSLDARMELGETAAAACGGGPLSSHTHAHALGNREGRGEGGGGGYMRAMDAVGRNRRRAWRCAALHTHHGVVTQWLLTRRVAWRDAEWGPANASPSLVDQTATMDSEHAHRGCAMECVSPCVAMWCPLVCRPRSPPWPL